MTHSGFYFKSVAYHLGFIYYMFTVTAIEMDVFIVQFAKEHGRLNVIVLLPGNVM